MPDSVLVRRATITDLPRLRQLDALCFPPGNADLEPAGPEELQAGVSADRVLVLARENDVLGYLQFDRPAPDHIFISGLAVEPSARGQGYGALLLDECLRDVNGYSERMSVTTSTSPNNIATLRLLLSRRFVVRAHFANYFGPGKDRFYCQFKSRAVFADPDDRYLVPSTSMGAVLRLLAQEAYVITDVVPRVGGGIFFEVTRFDGEDAAALQANEASASLSFSSALLAALTFLLGFSFASRSFPDATRVLLLVSTFASLVSLIVYANASGDLSRLQRNTFGESMKWGNLLSEYGGVTPFVLALPITFANVSSSRVASYVVAAALAAGFLVYEWCPFSYRIRYGGTKLYLAAVIFNAILTISGVSVVHSAGAQWLWAALAIGTIAGRILIAAPSRVQEERAIPLARWQSRL